MKLANSLNTCLMIFSLFLLLFAPGCKKSSDTHLPNPPASATAQKVKRPHGAPLASAKEAVIGSGGGTLVSADGRLTLTVPAGAVESATTFSIQSVENTLTGNAPSYRLLPNDRSFKKDLTLRLSYAGLPLPAAGDTYLFFAFQDADGYYHEASRTEASAAAKTLTVQTRHFSDWTFFSRISLVVDRELKNGVVYLKANEKLVLNLYAYKSSNKKTDAYEAHESILEEDVFDPGINSAVWTYTPQIGSLSSVSVTPTRNYTAPSSIDRQQSVMITATVNGNLGLDNFGNPVRQMMLSQEVILLPADEEFFELNGQQLKNLTANFVPGFISIGGYEPGGNSIHCYVYGATSGSYACGQMGETGKCTIEYSIPSVNSNNGGFICFKPKDCGRDYGLEYSSGGVTITRLASVIGDYTEGTVTTTLFYYDWCSQSSSKVLNGRFKIRKRF